MVTIKVSPNIAIVIVAWCRALIDVRSKKMYLVGPGGYQIRLSPGSSEHQLVRADSGHLLLPCSRFEQPGLRPQRNSEQQGFQPGGEAKTVAFPAERSPL